METDPLQHEPNIWRPWCFECRQHVADAPWTRLECMRRDGVNNALLVDVGVMRRACCFATFCLSQLPCYAGVFIGTTENKNHLENRSTAGRCDRPDTCIGCGPVLLIAIRAALDQVLSSSGKALITSGVIKRDAGLRI